MSQPPGPGSSPDPQPPEPSPAGPAPGGVALPTTPVEVEPARALPDAPTGPDGKRFERAHPLTPLIQGWLVLVAIVIGVARDLVPDGGEDNLVDSLAGSLRWILPLLGLVVVVAAVAGYVTWRFTRFVIDDEELRIETGALFRRSKRIPFQRIQSIDLSQPLAARLFGLAELKIEAGAGDAGAKLRFLSRGKASQLRDYLLTRAAGERRSVHEEGPQASAWTDLSSADEVLVRLTPGQLLLGFLLSGDFLVPVLVLAVGLGVTGFLGVVVFALPAVIPFAIGLASAAGRQVLGQFNYTLSRSGRGLRISRGLTNLTSQSVPVDRIQGISISQGLPWRPFGLYRVRIDVLGSTTGVEDGSKQLNLSLLFPVATRDQVRTGLAAVLPEVDLDAVELRRSPSSSRWLRWGDWWTLRHGWDDRVVVTRRGWLLDTTAVVPHAKTQSVRITQGPAQRALRLATVHVDTTPGPVTLQVLHVAVEDARTLATGQLQRMRRARAEAPAGTATGPARALPPEPRATPQPTAPAVAQQPPGPDAGLV